MKLDKIHSSHSHNVSILDCTLRDGSYLIDYQFSAEDCFIISNALSRAGICYIEVGHGLGLDAQSKGKGLAAEEDLRYVEAAFAAVDREAKIGCFFIPGIGELGSIKKMTAAGLKFLRIGTNIYESSLAENSIKYAKDLGLEVSSNLMKSYAVPVEEFVEHALRVESYGADTVCLVDSAGGMTPREVRRFFKIAKKELRANLGFHGHNNLQLAVANCITAIEEGASIIDGSLRGMGRSAGNAATEILAALLTREGYSMHETDWQKLTCLSEKLVVPIMPRDTGLTPSQIVSGVTYFHSGFQDLVDRTSAEKHVPASDIILQLGEKGKMNVTPEMVEIAAEKAIINQRDKTKEKKEWKGDKVFWGQAVKALSIVDYWNNIKSIASKRGFEPVLTISRSRKDKPKPFRFTPVRAAHGYCIGHVESSDKIQDTKIFSELKDTKMKLMVERCIKVPFIEQKEKDIIFYDDDNLRVVALLDYVRLNSEIRTFYLPDSPEPVRDLAYRDLCLYLHPSDQKADLGIAFNHKIKFSKREIGFIKKKGTLLLAQVSSVTKQAIDEARRKELKIIRLDFSETLVGEVSRLFDTKDRIKKHTGIADIQSHPVVSGGTVGTKGAVVVNSINDPTSIYGIADGYGGISSFDKIESNKQNPIMSWILSKVLSD